MREFQSGLFVLKAMLMVIKRFIPFHSDLIF